MSDNGSHFTTKEVESFIRKNGARQITSPEYTPHVNGLCEGAKALILHGLRRECVRPHDLSTRMGLWPRALKKVLRDINRRIVQSTGFAPAELRFGWTPNLDTLMDPPEDVVARLTTDVAEKATLRMAFVRAQRDAAELNLAHTQQVDKVYHDQSAERQWIRTRGAPSYRQGDDVVVRKNSSQ